MSPLLFVFLLSFGIAFGASSQHMWAAAAARGRSRRSAADASCDRGRNGRQY
jgi:hypothetical protein